MELNLTSIMIVMILLVVVILVVTAVMVAVIITHNKYTNHIHWHIIKVEY